MPLQADMIKMINEKIMKFRQLKKVSKMRQMKKVLKLKKKTIFPFLPKLPTQLGGQGAT